MPRGTEIIDMEHGEIETIILAINVAEVAAACSKTPSNARTTAELEVSTGLWKRSLVRHGCKLVGQRQNDDRSAHQLGEVPGLGFRNRP